MYCEICEWKKIFEKKDDIDLIPIQRADIPQRADGQIVETIERTPMYKCPGCGRLVKAKELPLQNPNERSYNPFIDGVQP